MCDQSGMLSCVCVCLVISKTKGEWNTLLYHLLGSNNLSPLAAAIVELLPAVSCVGVFNDFNNVLMDHFASLSSSSWNEQPKKQKYETHEKSCF